MPNITISDILSPKLVLVDDENEAKKIALDFREILNNDAGKVPDEELFTKITKYLEFVLDHFSEDFVIRAINAVYHSHNLSREANSVVNRWSHADRLSRLSDRPVFDRIFEDYRQRVEDFAINGKAGSGWH